MNKFIAVLAIVALLGGVAGLDTALAAPKDKPADEGEPKDNNRDNEHRNAGVLICHVTHSMPTPMGILHIGKVIRVSESAVDAHLAKGDRLADEGAAKGDPCMWLDDGTDG